jgi:putative YhbY family RNA-binding protein
MRTLAPAERRAFRAKAHALHPVVAIGQHGLTPAVLHEIDVNLLAHELIKIRVFGDDRDAREALFVRICGDLDAAPVQHLGKVFTIWRPAPPPEPEPERVTRRPRSPDRKGSAKSGIKTAAKSGAKSGDGTSRRKPAGARTTAAVGAKHAPRRGRSVIQGLEPTPHAPRRGVPGTGSKPASRRAPQPHGKSASSSVGASGARRRRKAR